jgi:4-carboxymuconolactone decarboxylase
VLRGNQSTDTLQPRERVIIDVVRSLFRTHAIPDPLYQSAEAELGREALIELVALVGYYGLIGFILNGFDVDLPPGAAATF